MVRLRMVSPRSPGWSRRRAGKGFTYVDEHGDRLSPEQVERIRSLAIPPAWRDVWICPRPNGHLQAVGTDDAGRRQYLYHPVWREKKDREKFDRVLAAAETLPEARARVAEDIRRSGMPLLRADAVAFRLLDLGYFRIGNDAYADAHGSFGLTTLQRRHVHRHGDEMVFRFVGKSGIEHTVVIDDEDAIRALETMRRRRSPGDRLMAYRETTGWRDLDSAAVNSYLRDLFDGELTAKDFRTWHATVLAAAALARSDEPGSTAASRNRAIRAAVLEAAGYLGNTPTVARHSYIDPRVIDRYESGTTIGEVAWADDPDPAIRQSALESATIALLRDS
ncbi:DNA topoisomerase IB [Raineyella fluvialis]|uniref:DNA topoisomerase n=1 Tax=Raineyella fluvialis TaxID=2662261 RepID=A0A5Q2F9C6_9ACTN|nr:DNA topoisomerase IB [Raineyella fluvialis]QGF22347.1 DNA topoisomerase IB [Raineyella fluvialis]